MVFNNPLQDKQFLKLLDNETISYYLVKIIVLDNSELPISQITGRIKDGSININADSSVRRTCNLSFVALEEENDLTNVDNLLSINKKIKIEIGIQNNTEWYQEHDIIWFPQGIFVICNPSISHTMTGVSISLSSKDKKCLLNGECGGGLPAPITFDSYKQELEDGTVTSIPQLIYHIIQTLVCNYGGESLDKIFINDVPLETKQIVRYIGSKPLYYNSASDYYTTNQNYVDMSEGVWRTFEYNENVGYTYTDFVYPGELQSGIGDNVCSVLDKIKNLLGNYEYFYDINGNFIFQEIKNYLNNSYDPTDKFRLDNNTKVEIASNNLSILDNVSYQVDFNSNQKSVYNFEENSALITSYSNTPVYTNIKNDFHIWGKDNNDNAIHYHIVIKEKPAEINNYKVVYLSEDGRIRLATAEEINNSIEIENDTLYLFHPNNRIENEVLFLGNANTKVENETLFFSGTKIIKYKPEDWRAELYLQGLSKKELDIRPDIYEQELLDLFDSIYDFQSKEFKVDIVNNPNGLKYFFDYLEPSSSLIDISVNNLYPKVHSYQQDNINSLYSNDIPNIILININEDIERRAEIIERCEREGQPYANIDSSIAMNLAENVVGYSAQDVARDLLYQYTHYNENIAIQSKPIYYLDANNRISVYDQKSGISGDYVIKTISISLNARNTMSINASKIINRI